MIVESYEDIIILSGALRSNFWETIHTAISLTLKRHPTGVIVDCAGITECTPEGADTFLDVIEFIEEHDARIIVARAPKAVIDAVKSTPGVRSQLPMAATVEEARKSLDLLVKGETVDKKRKPSFDVDSKIVLLLTGESSDAAGAKAAIRIAQIMHASVVLTYVILVPRDLPLQAPLPKEEGAAMSAIAAVEPLLAEDRIHSSPKVERGREIGAALDEIMRDEGAHTLIIALSNDPQQLDNELKMTRSVLTKVTQSVMLIRPKASK